MTNKMKKSIYTLSLAIFLTSLCQISLGQSKKERIQELTHKVDSVSLLLNNERSENAENTKSLHNKIIKLDNTISVNILKIKHLENQVDSLNSMIILSNQNLSEKESDLKQCIENVQTLETELNERKALEEHSKTEDSLSIVKNPTKTKTMTMAFQYVIGTGYHHTAGVADLHSQWKDVASGDMYYFLIEDHDITQGFNFQINKNGALMTNPEYINKLFIIEAEEKVFIATHPVMVDGEMMTTKETRWVMTSVKLK